MTQRRTLLGIFAHPDDESFGPGATLARYAAEGSAVHVIIATDGIAGSVAMDFPCFDNHESLAQVRSTELSRAAVALGLTSVWSLPYRDSGMRGSQANSHPDALIRQPIGRTVEELLDYLLRLRPQVVVTHDPYGGYGHPDHIRVCEATTAAFHLARAGAWEVDADGWRGPEKLYYTAFPKTLARVMVRLMPLLGQDPTAFGRNRDIDLVQISQWETTVTTRVDVSRYLAQKSAASEAHASQYQGGPAWLAALPAPVRRRVLDHELFTCAFPNAVDLNEEDLFSGTRC